MATLKTLRFKRFMNNIDVVKETALTKEKKPFVFRYIGSMFLAECWRLETSSRLFYDFIKSLNKIKCSKMQMEFKNKVFKIR